MFIFHHHVEGGWVKMTRIVQIVHDYLTGFETLLGKESMQKLENLERNQAVEDAQLILLKKMEKVVGHLHWDQKKSDKKLCHPLTCTFLIIKNLFR